MRRRSWWSTDWFARVVDPPDGRQPFRARVDSMHKSLEEVFDRGDRTRSEFFRRFGPEDLLEPVRSE